MGKDICRLSFDIDFPEMGTGDSNEFQYDYTSVWYKETPDSEFKLALDADGDYHIDYYEGVDVPYGSLVSIEPNAWKMTPDGFTDTALSIAIPNNFIVTEDTVIKIKHSPKQMCTLSGYEVVDTFAREGLDTLTKAVFTSDMGNSEFDLVIETEEEFKKCVYMLHPNKNGDGSIDLTTKGEPNPDFNHRYILVRGIDFTENLGSSDLSLAVLQPSIRYIKFDNCKWHCMWYLSGEEPTELNSTTNPTEYKKANTQLNVILDGITIDEQNVLDSLPTDDDPDRYYYVGLRNFERIENCYIHYPKDYALIEETEGDNTSYRYSFKFNLQYFTTVQNCKVTALWDGENISGCRITERIVRCHNCTNILAEPILKAGEPYRVQMRESSNLSNIYGSPIIYTDCKAVDTDTCSEYDASKASEVDEFDLIITSMADMAALPSNTKAKNVLVTGFTLSSKTAVPGFFDNTINASNEPYFVKFVVPKNVSYLKFSKSFYYTLARVVIQGHPDCIIDGLPTITAPYNYTQCTALYDFKEVRNCYARGTSTYDENDSLVENFTTVGISNVLIQVPDATKYPSLAPSYNYQKTRFINCDLAYINYAESVTNSRIITTAKLGVSPYIKNVETINGLKISSIAASQKLTLQNCSRVSNVNSNGYNIVYDSCSKVDIDTCDNVPEELINYVTKDFVNESTKDLVSNSKLQSSIEYDLIISSVNEFKALESNTAAVNVLVQNFSIYRADHVNGFFDNSASDYMYWTKFRIPANVKYIKFNNFKQQNSRVVIQGHEDCIIDGFPTVTSPYTAAKLYGNTVVLYNFKEVRNCQCTGIHQIDADGNYTFVPGVNGISNVLLDMPYPAEKYSITISGENTSIDTTNLAPDREEQNTKFVNCDLMFIKGASTIENCRVHMSKLMTDYSYKMSVPTISDVDLISGLTVQHIASNKKLTVKNCKNIFGINENSYTVDYVECSNIGATQEYVDEAVANADVDLTGYATEKYVNDAIANIDCENNTFDVIITSQEQLLSENLANKRALIKDTTLMLAEMDFNGAKYVEFNNVYVASDQFYISFKNFVHGNFIGLIPYDSREGNAGSDNIWIKNFGFVENLHTDHGDYHHNDGRQLYYLDGASIMNCHVSNVTNCCNIVNCHIQGRAGNSFFNCSTILNLHDTNFDTFEKITFTNCSHLSNIKIQEGREITYTDCTHVDRDTCDGYIKESEGDGPGDIDLTGYATEQYVQEYVETKLDNFEDDLNQAYIQNHESNSYSPYILRVLEQTTYNSLVKTNQTEDNVVYITY